ncbi:MAG: c-type cytochrome [Bacteroidetes bacterium]|nr:c-type cytochrome [Bacteroidota bacterium]
MNRGILTVILLLTTFFVRAQEAEDIIITEIRTFYKTHYQGEALFEENCASCHGVDQALISVALGDVHLKRSREWLLEFLQRPQTMQYRLDEETQFYVEEYGSINHEVFKNLNEEDYGQILNFIESETNGPDYDKTKLKEEYFVLQKNTHVKVGDYRFYFPDTLKKLSHHYKYNNGLPWEVLSVYDKFGDKKNGGTLKNGTGTLIAYDDYGNKQNLTTYVRGFRNGEYKQYFAGGELELLGYYSNGKANGAWSYYYPSGQTKSTISYRNGRIISTKQGSLPYFGSTTGGNSTSVSTNRPTTTYSTPASSNTSSGNVKSGTVIYPYNATIQWDKSEANNPLFTDLGNDFISMLILKKTEEIYLNATPGFKRFHPPVVVEKYVDELSDSGAFEYYRVDNVGLTEIDGNRLVLMEYYLSYTQQNYKMYLSYIRTGGQYRLDGWSFEIAD